LLSCAVAILAVGVALAGCGGEGDDGAEVVVYTALDQVYSEPILNRFQEQTGIRVKAVYDAEAAKTTGLVGRLLARRDNPDCDVFWSNEIVQTERLAQKGVLTPYASGQADRFPDRFRDPDRLWTGFAARMRVIIYNTDLVSDANVPRSLSALTDERWRGRAAIARPLFGTTLTHMAALYQAWGAERLGRYLEALRANDVALCPGNGSVRDLVAAGERAFGLTDTDDAHSAMVDGQPVAVVIPDAADGVVLIPNTVALIRGGPNTENGRKLIDYLLSADVERRLAAGRSAQIPLATDLRDVKTPWHDLMRQTTAMSIDIKVAARSIPEVIDLLRLKKMDR
jgi:iron(III) transport system substrate-binding protein